MPGKKHPKNQAGTKGLGKEIAAANQAIHQLRLARTPRMKTSIPRQLQVAPLSINKNDHLWKGDVPEGLQGYTPNQLLMPLQRMQGKVTEDGLRWAIEHMDPCGAPTTSPGVPDLATGYRLIKPQRFTVDISPPVSYGVPENGGTLVTYDAVIFSTPFPEVPFMSAWKESDGTAWNETSLFGGTWTLNANAASNVLSVWYMPENLPAGAYPSKQFEAVRKVSQGFTTELIGPAMYTGGRVISGQVTQNASFSYGGQDVVTPASNTKSPQIFWRAPSISEEALIASDPLYGERNATLGDYNVTRVSHSSGIAPLCPTTQVGEINVASNSDTEPNGIVWNHSTHHAMFTEGFNISMIFYNNINVTQAIRVKYRGTIEGVPKMNSVDSSLAKCVPDADPTVIRLVADITNQLPHSYPASYNDLGGLLGVIGNAFKHIGMPILSAVGGLGLPVVSQVAGVLHSIGSAIIH